MDPLRIIHKTPKRRRTILDLRGVKHFQKLASIGTHRVLFNSPHETIIELWRRHLPAIFLVNLLNLGEKLGKIVPGFGGNGKNRGEIEELRFITDCFFKGFECFLLPYRQVPFIDHHHASATLVEGITGNRRVLIGYPLFAIDHQNGDIASINRFKGEDGAVLVQQTDGFAFSPYAGGVYQNIAGAIVYQMGIDGIARGARDFRNNAPRRFQETVDQGGFADVRPAYNSYLYGVDGFDETGVLREGVHHLLDQL